jgi:hypothetical protein
MYNVPYVAHPSYQKTIVAIRSQYFWPRMKKDMVDYIARCMEFKRVKESIENHYLNLENYLNLVEFDYNNEYQVSLKMSPFEALDARKCNTSFSWDNLVDKVVNGSELLREMEEHMV